MMSWPPIIETRLSMKGTSSGGPPTPPHQVWSFVGAEEHVSLPQYISNLFSEDVTMLF